MHKHTNAEILLKSDNTLNISFVKDDKTTTIPENTAVIVLLSGKPIALKKIENAFVSAPITTKLPALVHVLVKGKDGKLVDKFQLDSEICEECNLKEYTPAPAIMLTKDTITHSQWNAEKIENSLGKRRIILQVLRPPHPLQWVSDPFISRN